MKNTLLIIFISTILCCNLSGQAFAKLAEIPSNPNNDPDIALGIAFIKSAEIPDQKNVKIKPYPESEIIQTNKGQYGMLPSVRLVAYDDLKKVIEFYKNELKEWHKEEFYGIQMFWKGTDKMKAMMGSEPVVQIENADKFNKLIPKAKATILIGYEVN